MGAAKLDEIEREIAEVRASPLGRRLAPEDCWMDMRVSDAAAFVAAAREAIRLRGLIDAHNAPLIAGCRAQRAKDRRTLNECYCAADEPWEDRQCDVCPRRYLIDVAAN